MTVDNEPAVPEVTTEDRSIANAQGALDVVQATSATVDEEVAAIDERASEQAADADWVVDEVSNLSATIEEVAATATQVTDRSEQAAAEAAEGREAAAEAIETMEEVSRVSGTVASEVDDLRDRIDRIADALAGIDRIADQTNMLALNASIEAARTDGDAEGFAVVADEIKQLAEESQQQADEIDEALEAVRSATDETVGQLEDAVTRIDAGATQVTETMDSLDTLAETVEETADGVASVSTATDEQAESSEAIAQRCEQLATHARAIEAGISTITEARSEQTRMLGEIDDVLAAADADRRRALADAPTLSTGVSGLDDLCGGGFLVGGQAVVRHDPDTAVNELIAQTCATAVAAGQAVSLTPPRTLDRETLASAFAATDRSVSDALATDDLFVLDMFGSWDTEYNVFDLDTRSLADANETTATRRDAPLLIVGNIEAEVAAVGERAAREARYENDDGVFDAQDTVLNIVADTAVPEELGAFYAGAADQTLVLRHDGGQTAVELLASPTGTTGVRRPITELSEPPFLRVTAR
ncbi:methyl-accepting chemotaxis protein [Haloarcula sp. GH36]|uniref:methyl-accepting chemotaxis protein n=1 Tax=Haloarcula montana TaxID=3111776 RepID=UPI002D7901F0|nr:methyl-accepting chemotaxis protein [Haloarcula sp. GH36]